MAEGKSQDLDFPAVLGSTLCGVQNHGKVQVGKRSAAGGLARADFKRKNGLRMRPKREKHDFESKNGTKLRSRLERPVVRVQNGASMPTRWVKPAVRRQNGPSVPTRMELTYEQRLDIQPERTRMAIPWISRTTNGRNGQSHDWISS